MLTANFFLGDQQVFEHAERPLSPRVSVILPTYCRGDNGLLARSVSSVLGQSFSDFELIIVDDGSTDGTRDVIRGYSDPRIVYVRHDQNSGLPALRVNEGVMMARGEYIAYQFDDDVWTPNSLKLRVAGLDANPEYGVAYGLASVQHGEQHGTLGGPFNFSKLLNENYIANNTVMHRRILFDQHGGYDMHLVMRRLCDWDLWLRWARETRFLFVDQVLSNVYGMVEGSLGLTAYHDQFTTRFMMGIDRNSRLTPSAIASYDVADLSIFSTLGKEKLAEIWRLHVEPFRRPRAFLQDKLRPHRKDRLNVIVTKADFDTNVDITITNLAQHLRDRYTFTYIPSAQLDEHAIRAADIVIFHRTMDMHTQNLLNKAKGLGKCTVYLMDDDLLSMGELGFDYLKPGATAYSCLRQQLQNADLVIAYSDLMAESARQHSAHVAQLTTNIESRWLEEIERPTHSAIRIAFAGGGARKDEMSLLLDAMERLSKKYGDRLEFHFWGCKPDGVEKLGSPVFFEPFTFSYNEYLQRLTGAGFDMVLVPLYAELRAKRAKCPIKFLEGTAAGAIGVYSDVEPYAVVEDGVTGFKCDNKPRAWAKAIERAIEMGASERAQMVRKAREVVLREFSSEAQARELDKILDSAWTEVVTRAPKIATAPQSDSRAARLAPIPRPIGTGRQFALGQTCSNSQLCVHAGRCLKLTNCQQPARQESGVRVYK